MTTVISSFYCIPIYLLKITQLSPKLPFYRSPFRHFSSLRHFHKHLVCNPIPRCSYETRYSFGQLPSYPLNKLRLPSELPIYGPPFFHFSSLRHFHKHFVCNAIPRCSYETRDSFGQSGLYPKPSEIKWKKELCNYVQLIGNVALPVKLIYLQSGKVVSSTKLGVRKSATQTSWIKLAFSDELAHIAHQHLQKGDRIYVSGCLMSYMFETEGGKQQTNYQVDVQQLNFVEMISPSLVSLYDESYSSMTPAAKFSNSAAPTKRSTQELWQAFFANPTEWLDIRNSKKNPKSPDFQNKDTGEALWVVDIPSLFCTSVNFSSLRHFHKPLVCNPIARCSYKTLESFGQSGSYPKPSEVKWKKELCNSVQCIGYVGSHVELTHFKPGKVLGSTGLGVEKSATDKCWIPLTFWDELAHIAHQHLQKGNLIYVSGRLLSDTVGCEEGKKKTYYKVIVQQLNLVENYSPSPVSAGKFGNSATPTKLSIQELWQAFFANPTEWWDNRNNKKNPKAPDFKHKDTGEALWVEDRYNPPWVKSQLEILDSRMQSYRKQDEPEPGLFSYLTAGL